MKMESFEGGAIFLGDHRVCLGVFAVAEEVSNLRHLRANNSKKRRRRRRRMVDYYSDVWSHEFWDDEENFWIHPPLLHP